MPTSPYQLKMVKKIIKVDGSLGTSKYKQIINSIIESIGKGLLLQGDQMPSINSVCSEWGLSRDTVLNAYYELKALGIISSKPGKGYYVANTDVELSQRIFLLFDELNSFKEDLYNAFLEALPEGVKVEIFFHHFNRTIFDSLLKNNSGNYTHFVVMPAMFNNTKALLNDINGRVIILDQLPEDLKQEFPAVFQNFEKDTYNALMSGIHLISKYKKITMIHPGGKEPEGQHKGFVKFCKETKIPHGIVSTASGIGIQEGEVYIAISDNDLVDIIKKAYQKGLEPGANIGIISYNDTALKEVVANGITTISTDFKAMGRNLAKLVFSRETQQLENPSSLIIRNSL